MSFYELAHLVTFRPLEDAIRDGGGSWTGYHSSPFRAPWSATVSLLAREIRHLEPRQAILELDMAESDFRNDGLPRANARAASPGVVLTLVGTPHGDLRYPCNTFGHWDENVRGIALALEALRKVDRYGVTKRGEQYAGWKALPAGNAPSAERGRKLIEDHGGLKAALRATHPDTSGYESAADFADVQAAR